MLFLILVLPFCALFAGLCLHLARYVSKEGWRNPEVVLIILGCFYPMGKLLEAFPTTPEYIRGHLADVGAIPATVLLYPLLLDKLSRDSPNRLYGRRFSVLVGFLGAVGWELGQFYVHRYFHRINGDRWDLIIYCGMAGFTWLLVEAQERREKRIRE